MLKQAVRYMIVLALLVVATSAIAQDEDSPEIIDVTLEALYPEGIAYDAEGERFFLSSGFLGNVYVTDLEGKIEPFTDDADLIASLGIYVDAERGRLLVANTDTGASMNSSPETGGVTAMLGIYDLADGERIDMIDLGALLPEQPHLANDIAVDDEGNIYITDSFSPVIYRVDVDNAASVFLQDDTFVGEGFNLNGIVYHPDGYLIVAQYSTGSLYNIPLDDPESFTEIELDSPVAGADGLVLLDETHLLVVANGLGSGNLADNQLITLTSDDGWGSADVAQQILTANPATTGTLLDEIPYVIFGGFDRLFDPTNEVPVETFTIQMVDAGTE